MQRKSRRISPTERANPHAHADQPVTRTQEAEPVAVPRDQLRQQVVAPAVLIPRLRTASPHRHELTQQRQRARRHLCRKRPPLALQPLQLRSQWAHLSLRYLPPALCLLPCSYAIVPIHRPSSIVYRPREAPVPPCCPHIRPAYKVV